MKQLFVHPGQAAAHASFIRRASFTIFFVYSPCLIMQKTFRKSKTYDQWLDLLGEKTSRRSQAFSECPFCTASQFGALVFYATSFPSSPGKYPQCWQYRQQKPGANPIHKENNTLFNSALFKTEAAETIKKGSILLRRVFVCCLVAGYHRPAGSWRHSKAGFYSPS